MSPLAPMSLWCIGKIIRDMVSHPSHSQHIREARRMPLETVALAADHGGAELKKAIRAELEKSGIEVLDLGTDGDDPVDYPDFALAAAQALKSGRAGRAILMCGTGIGISIAANRHAHIRAALVHDAFGARMARQHNDANVLVFGGRTIGVAVALDCVGIFISTAFEGGGRHARRVAKLTEHGER